MHIIIAPNAFKGSLSAPQAADCIAHGFHESNLICQVTLFPIADGGDGTASLIADKMKSKSIKKTVHDPLGRKIDVHFGWVETSKTAIIEMSEASGLRLFKKEDLDPLKANTRGTGELIKAALDLGAKEIILGVGGSATVDGASGLLAELGVRYLDEHQLEILNFPEGLIALKSIDTSGLDARLKTCKIVVLCDVKNTLLGEKGAAAVFGPQKGANENQVLFLEKCLKQLNSITTQVLGVEMSAIIYGGAAGGVAAGLSAFLKAELVSGIDYFLDIMDFEKALTGQNMVITAEGGFDDQTLEGKGPAGVAKKAKKRNIPVVILAGSIPLEPGKEMQKYFDAMFPIGHGVVPLHEAILNTAKDLKRTACELGNVLAFKEK